MLLAADVTRDDFEWWSLCSFPFFQNGLSFSRVAKRGRVRVQALIQAFVVKSFDEGRDLFLEFSRQIVIVRKGPVTPDEVVHLLVSLCRHAGGQEWQGFARSRKGW